MSLPPTLDRRHRSQGLRIESNSESVSTFISQYHAVSSLQFFFLSQRPIRCIPQKPFIICYSIEDHWSSLERYLRQLGKRSRSGSIAGSAYRVVQVCMYWCKRVPSAHEKCGQRKSAGIRIVPRMRIFTSLRSVLIGDFVIGRCTFTWRLSRIPSRTPD